MNPAWLKGQKVARVEMRPFDDGRGGTTFDPVIHFESGASLEFVVDETEIGEYGITPIYRKAPKERG